MFQLCPRGERIKLCGRAAWWRSEPVRVCYHVNPPSHDTTDCTGPTTPKAAPGLAAGNSSGSVFSLGSKAASHFLQNPKSDLLHKKDNLKTYILRG